MKIIITALLLGLIAISVYSKSDKEELAIIKKNLILAKGTQLYCSTDNSPFMKTKKDIYLHDIISADLFEQTGNFDNWTLVKYGKYQPDNCNGFLKHSFYTKNGWVSKSI